MALLSRHVYLASRSARRRELLKQLGLSFEVLLLREAAGRATDLSEEPQPNEAPLDYVKRIARTKADAGWLRLTQRKLMRYPVLSADTTVDVGGRILGKPKDKEQAAEFLRSLSGRSHFVHTAVALSLDERLELEVSSTEVVFRELRESDIRSYVSGGEPMDKAGAYAIQGRAAMFIQRISGSYTGVMGLPLFETAELLERFGFSAF